MMITEKVVQLYGSVKSYFKDFVPFWRWKINEEKPDDWLLNHRVIEVCRTIQYFLATFAVFFAVSFERSRHLIFSFALKRGLHCFPMDVLIYIILGYLLGLKRCPTNFISFVIIKTFTHLDENLRGEKYNFKAKVLGTDSKGGWFTLITASPKAPPAVLPQYIRNSIIAVAGLALFWAFGKFTKLDLRRYKNAALISQTIVTSFATILLVSTFAFDALPNIKEIHLKFCEAWIILAVATLVFVMLFLYERAWNCVTGKRTIGFRVTRMEWESFIFILAFSVTIGYLSAIHKELSVRDVLSRKLSLLYKWFVPSSLTDAGVWLSAKFMK